MNKPLGIGLLTLLAPFIITLSPADASAPAPAPPWGPEHVLYTGKVSPTLSQATGSTGMTVTTFRTLPAGNPLVEVAVQVSGKPWSDPVPLSSGAVARPTVLAWGAGLVSVIWQSPAGQDNYLFHLRTVHPDGTWDDAERLITARYAYPWYQAAINDDGEIALAWSNGDNRDRVVIRHADGTWTQPPPVPVVHPTFDGFPFTANPLSTFLDDNGQVSDITWGTIGASGRTIWLMRLTQQNTWARERIGPPIGAKLGYDWVHEASFAANASGDIAAVFPQVDPDTRQWSIVFRYRPANGSLEAPRVLGHLRCYDFTDPCGDVAVTADGTALIGWAVPDKGSNILVQFMRRLPDGTFTTPQAVIDPIWLNTYSGVVVDADARGDALLSFTGGNHQSIATDFSRCPAMQACETALKRNDDPSWLEPWTATVGPLGGSTITWVGFRHRAVNTRHLNPAH